MLDAIGLRVDLTLLFGTVTKDIPTMAHKKNASKSSQSLLNDSILSCQKWIFAMVFLFMNVLVEYAFLLAMACLARQQHCLQ